MTMQINPANRIAGVPIKQVRSFCREVARSNFNLKWLRDKLTLDDESARNLALELVAQGYVEALENNEYKLTDKGQQLVRSSAAGTIKRKTAEAALSGLLKIVEQYNSDPDKILTVETVVVFGSFLIDKEELGDLDVAVKHRDRDPNADRGEIWDAYTNRSGRTFSNIVDRLFWPSTELHQILKQRKRTISIQDWDAFLRLAHKAGDSFQYKVVFGDPNSVQAEMRSRVEAHAQVAHSACVPKLQ